MNATDLKKVTKLLVAKYYLAIDLKFRSQKNGSSLGASKAFFGRKLRVNNNTSAPLRVRSTTTVCAAAEPDRPLWFPGSVPPPWLDGSLPGDFGFDPLGL
ncbi:chlorophyll a-b binding protein, partial [Trifolium pratense]